MSIPSTKLSSTPRVLATLLENCQTLRRNYSSQSISPLTGFENRLAMFIYNVTTHVEPSIEQEWLLDERRPFPKMIKQAFLQAKLFKVITDQDQGGLAMPHNIIVIHARSMRLYGATRKALRQDAIDRFGNAILAFRTQLEEITTVA